jgi:hypothetical protein
MNNEGTIMIDQAIQSRLDAYRGNPQALAQRYQMSQDLLDLLALQKIKSEKEAAAREMQLQMAQQRGQPPTVAQQREQEVMNMTKQELAQQVGQVGQQQVQQQQAAMKKLMGGIAAAPGAQNVMPPQAMAAGGIVAFSGEDGSLVGGEAEEEDYDSEDDAVNVEFAAPAAPAAPSAPTAGIATLPRRKFADIQKEVAAEHPEYSQEEVDRMAARVKAAQDKAAKLQQGPGLMEALIAAAQGMAGKRRGREFAGSSAALSQLTAARRAEAEKAAEAARMQESGLMDLRMRQKMSQFGVAEKRRQEEERAAQAREQMASREGLTREQIASREGLTREQAAARVRAAEIAAKARKEATDAIIAQRVSQAARPSESQQQIADLAANIKRQNPEMSDVEVRALATEQHNKLRMSQAATPEKIQLIDRFTDLYKKQGMSDLEAAQAAVAMVTTPGRMTDLESSFRDFYAAAKADPANADKPDVVLRREAREKALSALGRISGEARASAAEAKTEGERMALMQKDIRFSTAVSKLGTKDPKVLQDVNNTLMELRREYRVGTQAAPAQAAPAQGAAALPAMPADEKELIDGKVYRTNRGPARWDEAQKKFFPVTQGRR